MTFPPALPALSLFSPSGTSPVAGSIFMYGLIFAIFYFILIRPQQTQRKQHEELIRNLKKGDEIVTSGGIVGEVVHIKETMKDGAPTRSMDDRITIKSAESRLIIERGRIAKIIKTSSPAPGAVA